MPLQEESLRQQIALGWVMELLIVVTMFVCMIIDSAMRDDNFASLRVDPGNSLKWLVFLIGLYALMPVYVNLVHGLRLRLFRWLAVALAVCGFLFFLLHHLAHWQMGQRPDLSSHALDLVLHLISLWVIVNSIRWARFPRPAAA
jgi:hypothetical protein